MNIGVIAAVIAINICLFGYIISEIVMSVRTRQQTGNKADRGTQRLIWILLGCCFVVAWAPVILDCGRLLILGDWLTWIGVAVMACGIIFRQYAITMLGRFFTGQVQIKSDHELIKTGPYRLIRHPSYLGILIITTGLGIALANWISLIICIVLPLTGIVRRIKIEERELEQHFGRQYQDYKKDTWAIIPYIF